MKTKKWFQLLALCLVLLTGCGAKQPDAPAPEPEVREALLEMVRRAGKGGVPVGALGLDPVFVRELFAEGLDFLAYGIDTILMYQTCREIMRSVFGAV